MSDLNDLPWKVYGLIDPRNHQLFYVGMSCIVLSRVVSHNTDRNGSAYSRCREIIEAGYKPDYCIFGTFEDAAAGTRMEEALITTIPGLYNRTNWDDRRDFWREFPAEIAKNDRRQAEQRGKE